jgi:hypothetical protein
LNRYKAFHPFLHDPFVVEGELVQRVVEECCVIVDLSTRPRNRINTSLFEKISSVLAIASTNDSAIQAAEDVLFESLPVLLPPSVNVGLVVDFYMSTAEGELVDLMRNIKR